MDSKPFGHGERAGTCGLVRAFTLCAMLLSGGPALAQSGAFQTVFGGGAPAAAPSRQSEPDRTVVPEAPTVKRVVPGLRPPPGTAIATKPPELSDEELAARDRRYSPPAGTPILSGFPPNPRLGRHLGGSVVEASVAGTRLGGGYNSPSPEAVTYDPADILDFRVQALSDPGQP